MKLPEHRRYDHVPIHKRAKYDWPNNARLAFTLCNNIEHFAFRAGLGGDNASLGSVQTQRNYAWRDYGNRVGLGAISTCWTSTLFQGRTISTLRLWTLVPTLPNG